MKQRWSLPTIASLSLSTIALAGVVVLSLMSCATPNERPTPDSAGAGTTTAVANLLDLQSAFNVIGETVSPSVVRINVRERVTGGDRGNVPFFDFFFGQPDDQEPDDRGFELGGVGSGIIVAADGDHYYILTNEHVVGDADTIKAVLSDGTELEAQLVGRDIRKDLAMISVTTDRTLTVARLGDSDSLRVGDWVVAIGTPFGYQNTVTAGIVSAIGRRGGPSGNISDFIQTDAAINQGNSGGALVNLNGEVVGINTWITSDSGGSIGLGFAIPINNVIRSINEFLENGQVEYGWLGVSIQSVDGQQVAALKLPSRSGALVDSVFAGSPAAEAGLAPGDFIYRIGDRAIVDSNDLVLRVGELPIGRTERFHFVRGGQDLSVKVTIAARDTEASIGQQSRLRWPGFSVYPLSEEIIEEAGLETDTGVIVPLVDRGSPADLGGLEPLDIVTAINGNEVNDLISFYQLVSDPDLKEWTFTVLRDGENTDVTVVR